MVAKTLILGKEYLKNGWGGRIRTYECRHQKPVPYRKARTKCWFGWVYFFIFKKNACVGVTYV